MATTAGDFLRYLQEHYPFSEAEEYDNCGLLIGDPGCEVRRCLLALDVTGEVIENAVRLGAELIITHHPVIFHPIRSLSSEDIAYQCVQNGIAVISSHTCLDKAEGGVNDALAAALGLENVIVPAQGEGYLRVGELKAPMDPSSFAAYCRERLGCGGVRAVLGPDEIEEVAVCSGSGGSFLKAAVSLGCDAFVTGEIRHHEAVEALDAGITAVEAGHFETETVVLPRLREELANAFPETEVSLSAANRPPMEWM